MLSKAPEPVSQPSEPVHGFLAGRQGHAPSLVVIKPVCSSRRLARAWARPTPTSSSGPSHPPHLHPHRAPCSSSASPKAVQPCQVPGVHPRLDHNLPMAGARPVGLGNPGEMDSQAGGLRPPHHLILSPCFLGRVPIPSWRPGVGDKDFNFHLSWVAPSSPTSQTPGSQRMHFSRLEGLLKDPRQASHPAQCAHVMNTHTLGTHMQWICTHDRHTNTMNTHVTHNEHVHAMNTRSYLRRTHRCSHHPYHTLSMDRCQNTQVCKRQGGADSSLRVPEPTTIWNLDLEAPLCHVARTMPRT